MGAAGRGRPTAAESRAAVEEALGYRFADAGLLETALSHPSFANDERQRGRYRGDNQRLEFLGDGVVNLVVAELLFESFPGEPEGSLSRMEALLVSEEHLAVVGRRLDVGAALRLSPGERRGGGGDRASSLADAVEALFAAVYLDGGFDAARGVVRRLLGDDARALDPAQLAGPHWKTALQERAQGEGLGVPAYALVEESGPDHDKRFVVEVTYGAGPPGAAATARGEGRTKKAAELAAAKALLLRLSGQAEEPGEERRDREPA